MSKPGKLARQLVSLEVVYTLTECCTWISPKRLAALESGQRARPSRSSMQMSVLEKTRGCKS
jgi:hypothetical protein